MLNLLGATEMFHAIDRLSKHASAISRMCNKYCASAKSHVTSHLDLIGPDQMDALQLLAMEMGE